MDSIDLRLEFTEAIIPIRSISFDGKRHKKSNRRIKISTVQFSKAEYLMRGKYWVLKRFSRKTDLDFSSIRPVEAFSDGSTNKEVLEALNEPNSLWNSKVVIEAGDNLIIFFDYINPEVFRKPRSFAYEHMSFVFKDNRWAIGSYSENILTEEIAGGSIKFIKNSNY